MKCSLKLNSLIDNPGVAARLPPFFRFTMKLSEKQQEFMLDFARLILWAHEQGYHVTAGELWRSDEQQAIYFKTGKSRVEHSRHQDRLAGDLNLFINGNYVTDGEAYKPLADYWKSLNPANRAGYDFSFHDNNHFERA